MTKKLTRREEKVDMKTFKAAFEGDKPLMLFYLAWLKNGLNATRAYIELHPGVTYGSATVLGSRWLARISKDMVMQAYGLNHAVYFKQLKDGLKAMRKRAEIVDRDTKGMPVYEYFNEPDHFARKPYHDKLGKMLGLEVDRPVVAVQQNNITQINDNELDRIIS